MAGEGAVREHAAYLLDCSSLHVRPRLALDS